MGASSAPRVIEATGKRWKGMQLAGVLVILGCFTAAMIGGFVHPTVGGVACLGVPVGFGMWIYGRFGGWWHHG